MGFGFRNCVSVNLGFGSKSWGLPILMENGVGIDLGETVMENEVLESRVEERDAVGSDESRESEGDDVFEEAISAETPRVFPEVIGVNRDYCVGDVGHVVGSVEVDEDVSVGNDVEKFEEAIGGPVVVGNHEEELPVVEHKIEGFAGGESVDEATEGEINDVESEKEKLLAGELNGTENDLSTSAGEGELEEVSGISAAGEMEDFKDGSQEDQKSGVVADGILVDDNTEVGDAQSLAGNSPNSQRQVESIEPVLHPAEMIDEVKETSGLLEVESIGEGLCRDESTEGVKESPALLDTGHHDDKRWENKDAPDLQGVNGNLISLDAENKGDKSGEVNDEAATSPVPFYRNSMSEELKDSANLGLENQDDGQELKHLSATEDSGHHGTNGKPEDKLFTSVEERTFTPELEKLYKSGNAALHDDEKIQTSPFDMGAKEIEGSQLQPADKLVETSNAVPKEPHIEGAKAEVVKQSIQGNGERNVKPAPEVSPSEVKSANPTPTPARPAGLGRVAPLLEPAHRVVQQPRVNGTSSQMQNQLTDDPTNGEAEENDETREKLQMIRVKFLRLAHRLGQTPHNVVVAQVLYRLGLAEQLRGRNGGRVNAFSFDRASAMAEQLETAGQEPLDFSCTIMVLGKSGIGKSATINSIFDEVMFETDAFQMGTKKVQDVVGTVQGIKVRVIDTPGLLPSWSDQRHNEKILQSVKRFIKKTPPDIVLYLDRLDMQSRDFGDMPLLRTITEIFGPSIWFNAIVVLTHAASAPPDGPNGTATSYDMFVTQRSHVVQQAIRQAAGDMRLMNPVSLVENHSACRTNRAGQRVLPNGQVWKPHLLLLSFASKILAEANTLLKLQDSPPGKPSAARTKAPPLPFLLSSLLQSRPQLKLPEEQFGDDDTLDDDLDDLSDTDYEAEYNKLPSFKRLTTTQLAKLTKAQKKAYYEELELREKLLMKKQLKDERKRRKMMKKMAASAKDLPSDYSDEVEEESGGAASVPVPMPDLALPASFDSDNPTHRYRHLDSTNQWVVRPVLDTHGWDHDIGYEGVNVEKLFVVKQALPVSFSGQVTKDKKDANLQMEIASSIKHGEGKATSLGFDLQTLGKDMAYTVRSETLFSNYRRNKASAGLSATLLGDALTAGVKVEDKLIVNKRFRLVMSGGAMTGRGDVAYGGCLEATLRDKDHPLGRSLSTLGLSVMDWHGDLAIGGNVHSQIPVGQFTNLIARANLNNRGSGQISIRLNSSEQLQIALVGLIPLLRKLLGYHQQLEFGQ